MTLEITVRGSAERHYKAERAVVSMAASIEGQDKDQVYTDAVAIQEPLTKQLAELVYKGAATTWSSDKVRVYSRRPWGDDGRRLRLVHYAGITASAEFTDFERLSGFLDYWGGKDGVEIASVQWDVTPKNRRAFESDVRRAAVEDAVIKAQAYADSLRRGRVQALQLADAGMLQPGNGGPVPMMVKAFAMDAAGGPQLTMTPEDIVIFVEVDARFSAE